MKFILWIVTISFLVACKPVDHVQVISSETTFISDDFLEVPLTSGKQHEIALSEKMSSMEKVKEIKDGVYQGVLVEFTEEGVEPSINFYTWKLTNDHENLLDVIKYNNKASNYGFEMGNFYLHLWEEVDDFFVSYHDVQLSNEFLEAGKLGYMYSSEIPIGASKAQLISIYGEPIVSDWYNGGILYSYNDLFYILDEKETVKAINMSGNRIKTILQDVSASLGPPSHIEYSELTNSYFYSYHLGDYLLLFEADDQTSMVLNIWLEKK